MNKTHTDLHTALGNHESTYDALFRHPVSHNLPWRDVLALLSALPETTCADHNGVAKITHPLQTLTLHHAHEKTLSDTQKIMDLRHFLEHTSPRSVLITAAAGASSSPHSAAPSAAHTQNVVVVIDHREARIYDIDLTPDPKVHRIVSLGADGAVRHLHNVDNEDNGQRKPEVRAFYTAVAKAVEPARQILVLGSGTGASSAMQQFLLELDERYKSLRTRVVGALAVDLQHLTEPQLIAKAREVFSGLDYETAALPAPAHSTNR